MNNDPPSLAEIKAAYPGRLLILLADAAPFISKTPAAAVKLAQRGGFQSFAKKSNGLWVANVRKLAEFIDSPGEESVTPTSYAPPVKAAKGRAKQDGAEKTVRPPSMAKALLAMRHRMELTRAQLDFEQAVFAELEAIAFREVSEAVERARPRRI